jgi:hypothetical protein
VAYFEPIVIGQQAYDLSHLEPTAFAFFSERAKQKLRVHVTYSNHCFTERYESAKSLTGSPILTDGGGRERVFCPIRYALSLHLPIRIASLNDPRTKVSEIAAQRNWCYTLRIDNPEGPYYVFFEIRRAGRDAQRHQEINLTVESAYPLDAERVAPALKGAMGFHLLCGKVYLRERTSTRR